MKNKKNILFTIRDEYEKHNKSGVNCMYFDADHKYLYSGGRDTIIRRWNCFYSGEEMEPEYMEHHIDWVNDLFLCENDSKLISASNDFTVKVWNTDTLSCISTIRNHTDYVTCLSYSAFSNKFVSGSLDKTILIWDLSEYNSAAKSRLECIRSSTKNSIYSIDIFKSGNVIISGDSSNTVRLTDLRDGVSRMELHGHTSTVKCVSHVEDNNLIISGGSDGMLIVWDMRQNKLLSKKYLHERGIWTMLVNKVGQKIYTSGQQGLLYYSEFNKELTSKLLYKTPHDESILNMCIQSDDIMWISKNTSYIDKLKIRTEDMVLIDQIPGSAPIIDFKVLNDKRNIITKKSNGEVEIYDVLLGKKIKSLGKTDYETEITKRQTIVYKHAWFNAEIKSGMLSIILDEIDCLNCWDVVEDCAFDKVNYGLVLLKLLVRDSEENYKIHPHYENEFLPDHLTIIIRSTKGAFIGRIARKNLKIANYRLIVKIILPFWVRKAICNGINPEINYDFYIEPLYPYPCDPKLDQITKHSVPGTTLISKIKIYLLKYFNSQVNQTCHKCLHNIIHETGNFCDVHFIDIDLYLNNQLIKENTLVTVKYCIRNSSDEFKFKFKLIV